MYQFLNSNSVSNTGGANAGSCRVNELSVAENEATSSRNAWNALVVAIRDRFGWGVGVINTVGVGAVGILFCGVPLLCKKRIEKTSIPKSNMPPMMNMVRFGSPGFLMGATGGVGGGLAVPPVTGLDTGLVAGVTGGDGDNSSVIHECCFDLF